MIGKDKHCTIQLPNVPFATYKGVACTCLGNMKDPELCGRHGVIKHRKSRNKNSPVIAKHHWR